MFDDAAGLAFEALALERRLDRLARRARCEAGSARLCRRRNDEGEIAGRAASSAKRICMEQFLEWLKRVARPLGRSCGAWQSVGLAAWAIAASRRKVQ